MMRGELPATVLSRRAVVYVRQSTGAQVQDNVESQRRQYALVDLARGYGFRDVRVIDDDLGRSASGSTDRPGFRSLVGQICEGLVGAVFCLEASRLARNGRDWHQLLELCGLVGACVIDTDGAYYPSTPNDRLLLGLKGTMSEFELTLVRKRMLEAAVAKARRGDLRLPVPIGYVWSHELGLMMDPDPADAGRDPHDLPAPRSPGVRNGALPSGAPDRASWGGTRRDRHSLTPAVSWWAETKQRSGTIKSRGKVVSSQDVEGNNRVEGRDVRRSLQRSDNGDLWGTSDTFFADLRVPANVKLHQGGSQP